MNDQQRINALELKLTEMQATYAEAVDLMQFLGGSGRVFQAATLALIETHPNPKAFRLLMLQRVEETSVSGLYNAKNESHVQGIEAAKKLVFDHLAKT